MFKGHPKGLFVLALANTGERFGYYTMLAVFALFLRANFGLEAGTAGAIYSTFLGLVYFMPLIGGIMADKYGFGKMVTIGISIMFLGYLLLSFPLGGDTIAMVAMLAALLLISVGTGLFKGNLQVMVGNLYDDPKYSDKRDSAFSLFYMAINIGALFAPTAAVSIKEWAETSLGISGNDAYHFSFAVACVALIVSMAIYYIFRPTFRHVEGGERKKGETVVEDNLTPEETKSRVTALILVFAVVIFFWMAFHQNGLTLTYFADEFTETQAFGANTMLFDVFNLALIIVAVYGTFSIFQSNTAKGKLLSGALSTAVLAFLVYRATGSGDASCSVDAPIFQQFNPFYVVALTPVSMAIFGAMNRKGKEPSAPRKIAYGMLVAAAGFAIMAVGSKDLNTPNDQAKAIALRNAMDLSEERFKNAGDEAKIKAIDKEIKEYKDKITSENKDFFQKIFDANTVLLTHAAAEAPKAPETPQAPEAPKAPETPQAPEAPVVVDEAPVVVDEAPVVVDDALVVVADTLVVVADTLVAEAPVAETPVAEAAVVDLVVDPVVDPVADPVAEASVVVADTLVAEAPVVETPEAETPEVDATEDSVMEKEAALAIITDAQKNTKAETRTSSYWLIFTYLILTFAELLLSPMGISFVSKVAPPKLKGMMMGGWFVATAIGNLLVSVGGFLWAGLPLWSVWTVFIVLCLLSALFMFVMMKKLEKATK